MLCVSCVCSIHSLILVPQISTWAHGARLSFEIYMQDSKESIENIQICRMNKTLGCKSAHFVQEQKEHL